MRAQTRGCGGGKLGVVGYVALQLAIGAWAEKMPGTLFVLVAGALALAIVPTGDSVLLASAAQVSHNIVMRPRPAASERVKVLSARVTVVTLAAI
jgi:Na+(H+)/acetate symporter ActP